MKGKVDRLRVELAQAGRGQELVRVHRGKRLESREGYVLDAGSQWLLLANLDPAVRLDGYSMLRVGDVRRVERPASGAFIRDALSIRGQWPPAPPVAPAALEDTRALLASLRLAWPLVTVHPELEDSDICFIGEIDRLGSRSVRLRCITPRAEWSEEDEKLKLKDVTRVDVGGGLRRGTVGGCRDTNQLSRRVAVGLLHEQVTAAS